MFRATKPLIGVLLLVACTAQPAKTHSRDTQDVTPIRLTPKTPACIQRPDIPFAKTPSIPSRLTGELGLFVAEVDADALAFKKAVIYQPDQQFPLASTYKQAVLWAVAQAIDAGDIRRDETFDVTNENRSLGRYPYDGDNIDKLAVQMIRYSDNTATDILHARVGLGKVQANANRLGLCNTRVVLPTKAWWTAQASQSKLFPKANLLHYSQKYASLTGEKQVRFAERLYQDAQKVKWLTLSDAVNGYFEKRWDPEVDKNTHNASTAYEMALFMLHEFFDHGLSPEMATWFRDTMATAPMGNMIAMPHTYFGGKGGNGWHLLSYTGMITSVSGRHYVYVFLNHKSHLTYTIPQTKAAFAWINAALKNIAPEEFHKLSR